MLLVGRWTTPDTALNSSPGVRRQRLVWRMKRSPAKLHQWGSFCATSTSAALPCALRITESCYEKSSLLDTKSAAVCLHIRLSVSSTTREWAPITLMWTRSKIWAQKKSRWQSFKLHSVNFYGFIFSHRCHVENREICSLTSIRWIIIVCPCLLNDSTSTNAKLKGGL